MKSKVFYSINLDKHRFTFVCIAFSGFLLLSFSIGRYLGEQSFVPEDKQDPSSLLSYYESVEDAKQLAESPKKSSHKDTLHPSNAQDYAPKLRIDKFRADSSSIATRSKPVATRSKPAVAKPKPVATRSKPVVAKPKSVATRSKPAVAKPKPAVVKPKPVATRSKPVATRSKPAVVKPKPVATRSKPVATRSKPAVVKPKPVATRSKPVATRSKPATRSKSQ